VDVDVALDARLDLRPVRREAVRAVLAGRREQQRGHGNERGGTRERAAAANSNS
jgi:hypothetical protein